jgi:hypothetical protein
MPEGLLAAITQRAAAPDVVKHGYIAAHRSFDCAGTFVQCKHEQALRAGRRRGGLCKCTF